MRSPGATFDLRAGLAEELREALNEIDGVPSRKAVHRCRVRLKRARALARVGRAAAPGLSAVFNDSARAVMRSLAHARELAALATAARNVAKSAGKKRATALVHLADALDAQRRALPPLDVDAARAGIRDLLALAQVWPEASPRQIKRGAERVASRARRARRRGHGSAETAHRHEWRKREKDRLYAVTLLGKAWPDGRPRRRNMSEALGDLLGRERDALLLIERIEREPLLAAEEARRALKALHKRSHKLALRADALGAEVHAGRA